MPARVFAVGRRIPGNAAEYVPFRSDKSLFDGDVILFHPTFEEYNSYESYAGRPLVSESDSPELLQDCTHWQAELKAAVEAGKIVCVFLLKPVEVIMTPDSARIRGLAAAVSQLTKSRRRALSTVCPCVSKV